MNPRTLEVIFINHVWQSCQKKQKTQIHCWPDTNWIVSVEQFLIVSQSLPKAEDSQHHIEKASGSKARTRNSVIFPTWLTVLSSQPITRDYSLTPRMLIQRIETRKPSSRRIARCLLSLQVLLWLYGHRNLGSVLETKDQLPIILPLPLANDHAVHSFREYTFIKFCQKLCSA